MSSFRSVLFVQPTVTVSGGMLLSVRLRGVGKYLESVKYVVDDSILLLFGMPLACYH